MDELKICTACGTQYPADAPQFCTICLDDRQYIPESGQGWTTHSALNSKHSVRIQKLHEHLYELEIVPAFAIGQRALLVISEAGNILWDCIALLNEPAIEFIKSKGGLKAIAFSHPHYYSNMNYWAAVFNCPVYIHQNDAQWIMNHGEHITLWNGHEKILWDGMRILNAGGHFPGSCILHVPFLSKEGAVLCGDTIYLSLNKKHFAVMYSYPNRIPVPLHEAKRVLKEIEALQPDAVFGFYSYQNLTDGVKEILQESFHRYC